MLKKICLLFFVIISLMAVPDLFAKQADLAGSWYTSDPGMLKAELEGYIKAADVKKPDPGTIAFIAPHAGYRYSGPIAAYTYKAIKELAPDTVIVIGFSHRRHFPGVAVLTDEYFETPLGKAMVDRNMTDRMTRADKRFLQYPDAFNGENSIEMQIPFVQTVLPNAKIVLLEIGDQSFEYARLIADTLAEILRNEKKYVIVGSTDMSHYLPYGIATRKDADTIKALQSLDAEKFYAKSAASKHDIVCGFDAVAATMLTASKLGADKAVLLKYANSGDTSGMKDGVVGYMSVAFMPGEERGAKKKDLDISAKGETMLNETQKKTLLKLARETIKEYLTTGKRLPVKIEDPLLNENMGAFVTLHERGELRGCIGHMVGTQPLCLTIRDMAIASATEDPRFPRVDLRELDKIDIEISVLTPMERIDDYHEIELGKHGVVVKMGWRSGVYLPQVATETGWDIDQFMSSLCAHKAGIPADAWKTGKCEIYIFTAIVFGEKEK